MTAELAERSLTPRLFSIEPCVMCRANCKGRHRDARGQPYCGRCAVIAGLRGCVVPPVVAQFRCESCAANTSHEWRGPRLELLCGNCVVLPEYCHEVIE